MASSLAPSFICFALATFAWGRGRIPPAAQLFLCAACGFLVAALLQKKGWNYQFYPVALHLLLAAAALCASGKASAGRFRPWVAGAVSTFLLSTTIGPVFFLLDGYSPDGTTTRVAALERTFETYAAPRESVFAFITSPRDIHPAVLESGRRWAGPSGAMIYLPAEIDAAMQGTGPNANILAVSRRESRELLGRLSNDPPAVIAFDNRIRKLGIADPAFDYIRHFNAYPKFRRLMERYREIAAIAPFRIFVRKRDASAIPSS